MSYKQELIFQLRLRGRSEREIADILQEVSAHTSSQSTLLDEFGTPAEYAAGFERRKRKTLGSQTTAIAVILALIWGLGWIAVAVARRFVLGIEPAMEGIIEPWGITVGAFTIAGVGLLAGFLLDLLRPAKRVP